MNKQTETAVVEKPAGVKESRQVARRRLFVANFASYPGFVMGRNGSTSAHSKMGGFVPRAERRNLARAFAAGEWRKRHEVELAALVP